MFRPIGMVKLNVVLLGKYLDRVTVALGEAGFVHLVEAPEQSPGHLLEHIDLGPDIETLAHLLAECGYLMENLGVRQGPQDVRPAGLSREELGEQLARIAAEYRGAEEAIGKLLGESGALTRRRESLTGYPFRNVRFADLSDLDFVYFKTGRLPPAGFGPLAEGLADKAVILHERDAVSPLEHVILFAPRKNRWAIDSELKKLGFLQEEAEAAGQQGTVDDQLDGLTARLAAVGHELDEHRKTLVRLRAAHGPALSAIRGQIEEGIAVARAKQHFGKAADLYCISGWVPAVDEQRARDVVAQASVQTSIVEALTPAEDERVLEGKELVPVQFPNVPALRPFQQMVTAFGAPRYGDLEPSLFVAFSFVLMFGIMFGDVGQGAVIMLAGGALLRARRPPLGRFRESGYLLLFCGGSAIVFGLLYGSVFGSESVLPHLWISPLHDIMTLFKMAVLVGIVLISVGILLNIANKLRSRNYFEGIFDKFGVIGVLFYWGAIGLGLKAALAGGISGSEVGIVVVLPLAILFLREPLYNLLAHKKKLLHEDIISFAMASAIEVMETVTVFLGSTVSFVRIGAFALSHAALCLSIYAIVGTLQNLPASHLWSLLVIVAGNAFVILLEGMVVMIQGIRLQYYELFSKYFAGDGVLYKPFELQKSPAAVKGEK